LTISFFYTITQIVRNSKNQKAESRKPLILLDLRLVIQVLLPLGSGGTPVMMGRAHQVPFSAPSLKALCIKALGIFYCKEKAITTEKQMHNAKLCICQFIHI